jgi:cell division protein FtsZ
MRNAMEGIAELRKNVDTLVVIPNDKLLDAADDNMSLLDAFKLADRVLRQGVQGISDLILKDGVIQLDFADVRTIMLNQGMAHMGLGVASGKNKIENAAEMAIKSPLLDTTIAGARAAIINFTGDKAIALRDIYAAANLIKDAMDPDGNIIFGATINDDLKDEVVVTVIATGLDDRNAGIKIVKKPVVQAETVEAAPAESAPVLKPIREEPTIDFSMLDNNPLPDLLRNRKKRT